MKSTIRLWMLAILQVAPAAIGADQIPWASDFRTACGMAAEQRRLVLLHFYNDNCEPCVRLERNVFSQPQVGEAVAQNYIPLKVHAGKESELVRRYQVTRWPTDVMITPSGLEVFRTVCQQKPAAYIATLNQVAQQTGTSASRQWNSPYDKAKQEGHALAGLPRQNAPAATRQEIQRSAGQVAQNNNFQAPTNPRSPFLPTASPAAAAGPHHQVAAREVIEQSVAASQLPPRPSPPLATENGWLIARQSHITTPDPGQVAVASRPATPAPSAQIAPPAAAAVPEPRSTATIPQQPVEPPPATQAPAPVEATASNATVSQATASGASPSQFILASQAPPIALEGFCPVTLVDTVSKNPQDRAAWKKGDPQFGAVHRGRTYLFVSAAQQQKFLASPDAYAPILSGYDPVHYAERGELAEGKRAFGVLTQDQRLVLFATEASFNKFSRTPDSYLPAASQTAGRGATDNRFR